MAASACTDMPGDSRIPIIIVVVILARIFVAGLTYACRFNPTPTNASGGGPGSRYPGRHRTASYTSPIGGNGPQSS